MSDDWKYIVRSDESSIMLFPASRRVYVRRTPKKTCNPECLVPTVKHGARSVMIWAAISWYYVGPIIFLIGRITASDYEDIGGQVHPVVQGLFPKNVPIFQDDISPIHSQKFFTFTWPCIVTNFFLIKPNRCTNSTNLFWHETLHVSDNSSVHHQDFFQCTSTLSNGICHTGSWTAFEWINSWWWTEELSETWRLSWQNKFVKLVHLVGFITKKQPEVFGIRLRSTVIHFNIFFGQHNRQT